jgi:two-component system LytT family sensor kinase
LESGEQPADSRVWILIAVACTVPAALDTVQTYAQARLAGSEPRWQDLVFQGTEWLFLGALTPITYVLGRRFPITRDRWPSAVAVHFAGAALLCLGWASLGVLLGNLLGRFPADNYISWLLTSVPWSVFMYFTVLGCVHAFAYFLEARERDAQASRLAAQLAEARLSALRMQIHPHFLFNTLNAIAVLVREHQTATATRMLELLGDMLRQVLAADRQNEVPLSTEVAFLGQYLAIEQIRFADRLQVTWTIDDTVRSAPVPIFVLQPLVENAVRHGVMPRAAGGRITIAARAVGDHLELIVEDDGVGMREGQTEGVGLSNTRERLHTLYGDRASFTIHAVASGGTRVLITIPREGRQRP